MFSSKSEYIQTCFRRAPGTEHPIRHPRREHPISQSITSTGAGYVPLTLHMAPIDNVCRPPGSAWHPVAVRGPGPRGKQSPNRGTPWSWLAGREFKTLPEECIGIYLRHRLRHSTGLTCFCPVGG